MADTDHLCHACFRPLDCVSDLCNIYIDSVKILPLPEGQILGPTTRIPLEHYQSAYEPKDIASDGACTSKQTVVFKNGRNPRVGVVDGIVYDRPLEAVINVFVPENRDRVREQMTRAFVSFKDDYTEVVNISDGKVVCELGLRVIKLVQSRIDRISDEFDTPVLVGRQQDLYLMPHDAIEWTGEYTGTFLVDVGARDKGPTLCDSEHDNDHHCPCQDDTRLFPCLEIAFTRIQPDLPARHRHKRRT